MSRSTTSASAASTAVSASSAPAFLGVSDPVDRGQEVVQIGGRRHAWFTFTPSAATVRSCAAWTTPPSIRACSDGRSAFTCGVSPVR